MQGLVVTCGPAALHLHSKRCPHHFCQIGVKLSLLLYLQAFYWAVVRQGAPASHGLGILPEATSIRRTLQEPA